MANVLIFGVAIILLLGLTNSPVGQAISTFLLAGIVPGTSIQLPWYFMPVIAPLLLVGLYGFLRTFVMQNKERAATPAAPIQARRKPKKTPTKHVAVNKKTTLRIRKTYAHTAKRKRPRAVARRRLNQARSEA